ncbi:hypothetical protein NPIL_573961 [Nephila pilipes]|uniref:Uncharacterized protein n=1 Tax=Nephila pilipes TaxID=299642 RepID=A0A8X6TIQ7_NEPPI|nr:hypothetical protein NPIL_573961 [Nephila pilipes]
MGLPSIMDFLSASGPRWSLKRPGLKRWKDVALAGRIGFTFGRAEMIKTEESRTPVEISYGFERMMIQSQKREWMAVGFMTPNDKWKWVAFSGEEDT